MIPQDVQDKLVDLLEKELDLALGVEDDHLSEDHARVIGQLVGAIQAGREQ